MPRLQIMLGICLVLFSQIAQSNWFGPYSPKYIRDNAVVNIPITLLVGDMTRLRVDAYVVPHFAHRVSYGGVGAAIANSGASQGLIDLGKIYESNGGNLDFGTAHLTNSGGGFSKYLINVISVASNSRPAFDVIAEATYNALVTAYQNQIRTIALPILGTGILNELSGSESANAMLSGLHRFAREGGTMDGVAFAIYGDKAAWDGFNKALNSRSYKAHCDRLAGKTYDATRWSNGQVPPQQTLEDLVPKTGICAMFWRFFGFAKS